MMKQLTQKPVWASLAALTLLVGMAGGAAAQNPGGISTAPIEWLRADSITGQADGSAVASWAAKAGQAVSQSAASQQPVYHVSGPNGKPYVTFSGLQGLTTNALTQAAGSYTVYIVARIPDGTNSHWGIDSQSGRLVFFPNNTGQGPNGGWYDGSFHTTLSSAIVPGKWQVFSTVLNAEAGTGIESADGTQVTSGSYTPTPFGGTTALGNAYDTALGNSTTSAALGDAAEVIIFPAALSSEDQTSVTNYLSGEYTAPSTVSIAPNNAAIVYSPYNWLVSASAAKTINAGAAFRTYISGTNTCSLGLSIGTATPYSEVKARLDGGAWQTYIPTASGAQAWNLTMPTGTTATRHLLEVIIKSTTETQDRWNSQTTAVQFTGLTLDGGATVSAPALRKYRVLVYGDSITEGVRVYGYSGITNDTDRNDNAVDYSYKLGELLDAEIGVVGFGGSGLTVTGSGNVPPLPQSYNLLWAGQARTFSPVPDLAVYNEGTNDGSAALGASLSTVISGIGYSATTYSGLPGTRHLVLRPFGGNEAANLQGVVSSLSSVNVAYGDTTGLFNTSDSSDGLHPYAYAHLGSLAPGVAALALPLLHPASVSLPLVPTRQPSRGR